jgi:hypothetical protein
MTVNQFIRYLASLGAQVGLSYNVSDLYSEGASFESRRGIQMNNVFFLFIPNEFGIVS